MTSGGEAVPLGDPPETPDGSPAKEFNWGNLGDLLGRLFRGVAFDHVLGKVLAIAVQAEQAVSDVVAIQLGRDEEAYAKPSLKKYKPMAARNEDRKVLSGLL
jgi:hypothetical protein